MPAKKDISEECAVCTEMSSGYHFGVIVCRACAAFFRRTIALDMKYKCRYDNNCPIDKTVRCMCRSCRLNKCLAVGMKKEAIQLNRDTLKRDASPRSHSLGRPPQPRAPASFLPTQEPEPEEDQIFQRINAIFEYATKYYKPSEGDSLLSRMTDGYQRIRQKRPLVHSEFRFIKRDPNVSTEENNRRVEHNGNVFVQMCKQEMDLLADMVTSFEPFITLPPKQRWIMFKHFWIHFMMFERAFDTVVNYGCDDLETAVSANGQKMQLCKSASEMFSIPTLDDEALDNLFAATNYLLFHGIYKPMVELKPLMEEFIAAAGYMLWMHPGSSLIATETIQVAKKVREEIFRDLYSHFVKRGEENNYAPRLAELMSIVNNVMKAVVQKKEDMLVVQLFDSKHTGRSMYEMYR